MASIPKSHHTLLSLWNKIWNGNMYSVQGYQHDIYTYVYVRTCMYIIINFNYLMFNA